MESTKIIETMAAELEHLRPMEASLEMAEADVKAHKQRVADLEKEVARLQRYHDTEATKWLAENQKLKDEISWQRKRIGFLFERVKEQDIAIKWHKVEILMGKLVGELPNRSHVWGDRCFLVHFQIIQAGQVHDGVMESDFDDDEGFFELEENMIPVHWCVAPMPPLSKTVIEQINKELEE